MIAFQLTLLLQYVVIGLGNGAVYAMVGLGLVVIYRSTGLLNFAQGEIGLFATFMVWQLNDMGLPLLVAMLGGMALGALFGAILFRVTVQPVGDPHTKPLAVVIVTIGLFLGINAAVQLIWGTGDRRMPRLFGDGVLQIGDLPMKWMKLGAVGVLAIETIVLYLVFRFTKLGLAMRAVASNPEASALSGIPVSRVLLAGWGLAAALGAVAGTFAAPDRGLNSSLMLSILVLSFAAITLGGFDSLVGAVVGGLVVGVVTDVLPHYVSFVSKMPLAPAFALILIVLLVKPEGLFGTKPVVRV